MKISIIGGGIGGISILNDFINIMMLLFEKIMI